MINFYDIINEPIINRSQYVILENTLRIDLLGAKKENISIESEGRKITISATKKDLYGKEWKYNKTFLVADIYDPSTIDASYEDGILEVKFNKSEKDIKTKVEIK